MSFPSSYVRSLHGFIASSWTTPILGIVLLLWVGRKIRSELREFRWKARARARQARLAPKFKSSLPFGLSLVRQRFRMLASGGPADALEIFEPGTKVIRSRYLGIETIHTLSHLDAKYILSTNFQNWGKSPNFQDGFRPLLGDGIFSSDQRGLWSWHRSLTRPHFLRERVADLNACEEHAARIVTFLVKKTKSDEVVDVQDVFSRYTLTVGTQHLFGRCLDMINELSADRPTKGCDIDATQFSEDFCNAQQDGMRYMMLPSFLRRFMPSLSKPSPAVQRVLDNVDKLIAIGLKEDPLLDKESESQNLLDHLRRSGCSAELFRHQLINILLAARDTTSSLLTSCIYELTGRGELWRQLQAEISNLRDVSNISVDDIRQFKLLRAVLNETLRLHPSVWFNGRYAFEDDVLPSGIFVPAGSNCEYYIREFQRDPEIWGKDAAEFIPERWLDERKATRAKDPFGHQPFSAGPRICLGQQFAYMEASIMLLRLLLTFDRVELSGPSAVRENFRELPSVTLSVRGGLWVKFYK